MKLNAVIYNKTRGFAGHLITIDVSDEAPVSEIKKAVEDATQVPVKVQWIVFGTRHLEDEVRLVDIGVQEGYTLYSVPTYVEIPEIPNL